MRLDEAAAVTAVADGRWTAEIKPGWDILGNANGGYLLAIAGKVLVELTGRPDPVTVTAHYLSPGRPGALEITGDIVREGRRFATARVTLTAGGKPVITVLGTFGDLSDAGGPDHGDLVPPHMPHPDACVSLEPTATFPPPFMGKVDLRLDPTHAGWLAGQPGGQPHVQGWFRLKEDEPLDTNALLVAVDAFPPTAFTAGLPLGWTPTIELTAHVRRRPEPGWLRCSFTSKFVTGGFIEADGEIWDSSDRLVAQSRQLALVSTG